MYSFMSIFHTYLPLLGVVQNNTGFINKILCQSIYILRIFKVTKNTLVQNSFSRIITVSFDILVWLYRKPVMVHTVTPKEPFSSTFREIVMTGYRFFKKFWSLWLSIAMQIMDNLKLSFTFFYFVFTKFHFILHLLMIYIFPSTKMRKIQYSSYLSRDWSTLFHLKDFSN